MLGSAASHAADKTLRCPYDAASGQGSYNYGRYRSEMLDRLIDAAPEEMDAAQRSKLIRQALAEHNAQIFHVPLHRQVIPWRCARTRTSRTAPTTG